VSLSRHVLIRAGVDASPRLHSLVGAAPAASVGVALLVLALFVAIPLGLAVRTVLDRDL
jgi:hypothetical protein